MSVTSLCDVRYAFFRIWIWIYKINKNQTILAISEMMGETIKSFV